MADPDKKKSFLSTFLCTGIILPAAFLFSLSADLPHVLIITLTGLILSAVSRKAVPFSDRTVIYSVVTVLVTTILFDYVIPMQDDRFEYLSSLFKLNITVPILLYLAVAVTFFGVKKYSCAFASTAAVVALAFGGNVMMVPFEVRRFIVPDFCLRNFGEFYLGCVIVSGFFILLSCRENGQVKIDRRRRKYRSKRIVIFLCIAVLTVPACYGFYRLFLYYETELRGLQNTLLNPMFFRYQRGQTVFGESAGLNQVISPEMLENQDQIVIRAISREEPGYLRGKAYTHYSHGKWTQAEEPLTMTMRLLNREGDDYRTFSLNRKVKARHSIEILVSSKLVSKVLFLPGNFTQLEIIANSLRYTENGNVSFQDWITDAGYTVYRPEAVSASAWQRPPAPNRKLYTQLPENLKEELAGIPASLPDLKKAANDQKRILVLLNYFRENFNYKIRAQPENPIDPVLSFLNETHEGHCEFYATSMTLLLRRLGIPARYVTGFICTERHPTGTYYVARVGNAHAWVEAFDREKKQWTLVEPTPPGGAPGYKHEWSMVESWRDIIEKGFQQLLSNMRRGYFARAIITFFVSIWEFLVIVFHDPVRGPVLGLLLTAVAVHFIRRRRKRRRKTHDFASPDEIFIGLGNIYRRIQRQLKVKYELEIPDSSTINDFIEELSKSDMPESQREPLIKLFREYEAMRYRKEPPAEEIYRDFKKRFHL